MGGVIESVGWVVPLAAILIGLAIILIALREFFLESIPVLKLLSGIMSFAWNLVVSALAFVHPVVEGLFDLLDDIAEAIEDIGGPDFSGYFDAFRSLFGVPDKVSAGEIKAWLQNILDTCVGYDDAWGVIIRLVHYNTHADACALARYVYPVPWLYAILDPPLRLFYSGASDPVVDHYAIPGHHNCENTVGDGEPLDVTCSALGAGFVLLDVVLPVLAGLLLLVWTGRQLVCIVFSTISLLWLFISNAIAMALKRILGL